MLKQAAFSMTRAGRNGYRDIALINAEACFIEKSKLDKDKVFVFRVVSKKYAHLNPSFLPKL